MGTKTKAVGLILLGLALGGAEECQEASSCAEGPQGPLSAWSECELYAQSETIMVHLTNEDRADLFYFTGCEGPLSIEAMGADGQFHPIQSGIQCVSEFSEWVPLPLPGDIQAAAWPVLLEEGTTLPAGTYRGAFHVGTACVSTDTTSATDTDCEQTERLHSQPFTVYLQ